MEPRLDKRLQEAKEIATNTTDDPVMRKYVEGMTYRILVLEDQVKEQRTNYWLLVFVFFGLPFLNHFLFGTQ